MTRDLSDKHFFRLEMWKVLWTFMISSGSSSLYATGLTLLRILNGPAIYELLAGEDVAILEHDSLLGHSPVGSKYGIEYLLTIRFGGHCETAMLLAIRLVESEGGEQRGLETEIIARIWTRESCDGVNGVAERMNKTLLERARAILATTSLGKSFWAEAVNTACYMINCSPSTAVELKTPMEMWTGNPGYHLWDPTPHKVVVNRDVVFIEEKIKENEEGDCTTKKTTSIQMEKDFQSNDSFEAAPQHEVNETNESQAPATRTLNREIRRPGWQSDYVMESNVAYCLLTEEGEPSTLQEALNNPDASFWKEAMQEEIEALHKNKTWELVPLPGGRKPIGNKWVYKIKKNGDDQVERYRARLVVKGYAQKEGIDFNEIFSPVVRMTTIRVVLAMCATYDLHLEQLDVKTAFLHGNLEEEIYMLQPEGFKQKGKENLVCRLNKSLYGLKQAPRCWYKRFDSFIRSLEYNRLHADPCAYFKRFGNDDFIILLLYVDDMLVAGPNKDRINKLKAQLAREFEMKDLGPANKILGMQIHRDRVSRKIWLSQKSYVKKILQRFNMQDCKPISTPFPTNVKLSSKMSPSSEKERMKMSRVPYASAVGSLMFAMICTRPDIAHAVGVVSRYMAEPGREHWEAVKRILRYIKGTSDVALCFGDSDLIVTILLSLIMQEILTEAGPCGMSTTKADYVAACSTLDKEAVWLKDKRKQHGSAKKDNGVKIDCASIEYSSGRLLVIKGQMTFENVTPASWMYGSSLLQEAQIKPIKGRLECLIFSSHTKFFIRITHRLSLFLFALCGKGLAAVRFAGAFFFGASVV
ncbi:retrovirus-related pol polyprotein from transposon TNT 1-94 [Tanacetum coccineum]